MGATMYGDEHKRKLAEFNLKAVDLPRFVEVSGFTALWSHFGLTDADLHVLQVTLAAHPTAGDVVAGTNGVRKIRYTPPGSGRGKSGAFRIFYLNLPERGVVFLIALLSKNDKANLSKAERNAVGAWVSSIKADAEKGGGS